MAQDIVSSSQEQKKPLALVVDDDRTPRMMLVASVEQLGYDVIEAENGQLALDKVLELKDSVDAILLDREMPVMSGMEFVEKIKDDRTLSKIPIIMQTGSDRPDQIKEGIDAGVFYYLTKPVDQDVLKSVLEAAIDKSYQQRSLSHELQKHKASFNLIDTCKFHFKTLTEAEQLASFLANCFPDANQTISGLAELLINAVEHGNLGVGYQGKTELLTAGKWREEVNRRATLPEHNNKFVEVIFRRKNDGCYVKIKDQGEGFDWRNYMQIDPARATDNHGRGIAQANMVSFNRLTYNETGNEVTAFVAQEKKLDW